MNFNTIKLGFQHYLTELSESTNKEYNTSNSDVSIFMYAQEFKDYISGELKVDTNILSMSVNDILKMEIVNGKLVDPESEEQGIDTEDGEDDSVEGTETTLPATVSTETGEETTDITGQEFISDLLNELFNDDTIKSIIDTDQSGELEEQEILDFLGAIQGLDGDSENISLDDILSAIQGIQDETFNIEELLSAEDTNSTERPQSIQETTTTSPSGSSGYSGVGSFGASSAPQEKTLANMNEQELNDELTTANNEVDKKQKVLDSLYDGSDSKLKELQSAKDSTYEAYYNALKELDENLAGQLDGVEKRIQSKENEINIKEQQISEQETTVANCENTLSSATARKENLQNLVNSLTNANESELSDKQKAALPAKRAEAQKQLDAAIQAEKDADEALKEEKDKLERLQGELETLKTGENGLDSLKTEKNELEFGENGIVAKYPQLESFVTAHNDAIKAYDTYKESAIATAKADKQQAQDRVKEVEDAISNYNVKKDTREYGLSSGMEDAVEWARKYDDMSQDQMRQVFRELGYQFDTNAWCADFVRMALGEGVGDENLPDWYRNIQNKAYCPNIQAAGEGHKISAEEAQTGDIVLYDWNGDGRADHVGLFVDNGDGSSTITAIEGNTSGAGGGSCVEEKARNRSTVLGIYSMTA